MKSLLLERKFRFLSEPEEPLAFAANLLDLALVFIVALVAITAVYLRLPDLLNPQTDIAIIRNFDPQRMEIVIRQGKKIKAFKAAGLAKGKAAQRLGVAYRLEDGTVVYVPDPIPSPVTERPSKGGEKK
ncbi:hypothetical protein HRbin17_02468 [bacterium HR17]|jgi:hypothetical protein|uniref:DUF2149 domain-containing protein n=1 Tax=Candidatus Fervidibacter japonicus TaxID=2035412 RepID=A0A2H5XFI6_9BACT|nr:hypothetical protein HRbin17_02468 [bacterium HR17]